MAQNEQFINNYKRLQSFVQQQLSTVWGNEADKNTSLLEACRYGLLTPGKRIRPILALASAELLEIPKEKLISFALALECLHAASLVHDDLPALDNDELRRGLPTCHRKFGEAVALLAGDALIGKAFELVAADELLPERARASLCHLLAKTTVSLCVGQALDIESKGKTGEHELLERLQLNKTAYLLAAAVSGPAYALENGAGDFKNLWSFGERLGLLFQVVDDTLDATASAETLGKNTARDRAEDRLTAVSVFGLSGARARADEFYEDALQALSPYGARADFLKDMAKLVLRQ